MSFGPVSHFLVPLDIRWGGRVSLQRHTFAKDLCRIFEGYIGVKVCYPRESSRRGELYAGGSFVGDNGGDTARHAGFTAEYLSQLVMRSLTDRYQVGSW